MADTKISDLAAVTDVQATDEFVLARAGTTKKITGADLESEIGGVGGGSGIFDAFALLRDEKSANTQGGSATTGAFTTHTLNTETYDPAGFVSLSSNEFTLAAGTYMIRAWASCYETGRFKLRIRNITDSTDVIYGESVFATNSGNDASRANVVGWTTIAGSKAFALQYRAETSSGTRSLGVESNMGVVEVYAEVEIWRQA